MVASCQINICGYTQYWLSQDSPQHTWCTKLPLVPRLEPPKPNKWCQGHRPMSCSLAYSLTTFYMLSVHVEICSRIHQQKPNTLLIICTNYSLALPTGAVIQPPTLCINTMDCGNRPLSAFGSFGEFPNVKRCLCHNLAEDCIQGN